MKATIQHIECEMEEALKTNKRQAQKQPDVNVILVSILGNMDDKNPTLNYKGQLQEVALAKDQSRMMHMGENIEPAFEGALISLVKQYADVFAYAVQEMLGINYKIMIHKLAINPQAKPLKNKSGHFFLSQKLGKIKRSVEVAKCRIH